MRRLAMSDPFPSTHWSLVLAAQKDGSSAAPALSSLCEAYWLPIYAYVRRRVGSADEAADLVQGFFVDFLEKRQIEIVRPEAGRFRTFLLHKVKQYMFHDHEKRRAMKRGGGRRPFPLDTESAERRCGAALVDTHTPETEYERLWAATLVERTMTRLDQEAVTRGRAKEFATLKPFISEGTCEISYREVGAALGLSETAVRSAVHRLRRRFGHLIREEIGDTVADPSSVDDELRHLLSVLS